MAHVPARLPRTEADLADWSVYADQLLAEDHPIGEPLAFELALPAEPDEYQVGWFQDRWRKLCLQHSSPRMWVGWAVGHARELVIQTPATAHSIEGPTLAAALAVLRGPRGKLLDMLDLEVSHAERIAAIEPLIRELPATCSSAMIRSPLDLDGLAPYLALLPAHVTRLVVATHQNATAPAIHALADRYQVIDVSARLKLDSTWLHPRVTFGDAGLVDLAERTVEPLARVSLLTLQHRLGLVPIQAQVLRSAPEQHWVKRREFPAGVSTLLRRSTGWTLRGSDEITLNGVAIRHTDIVPVADGDRIAAGDAERIFVARDLDRRFRELVG